MAGRRITILLAAGALLACSAPTAAAARHGAPQGWWQAAEGTLRGGAKGLHLRRHQPADRVQRHLSRCTDPHPEDDAALPGEGRPCRADQHRRETNSPAPRAPFPADRLLSWLPGEWTRLCIGAGQFRQTGIRGRGAHLPALQRRRPRRAEGRRLPEPAGGRQLRADQGAAPRPGQPWPEAGRRQARHRRRRPFARRYHDPRSRRQQLLPGSPDRRGERVVGRLAPLPGGSYFPQQTPPFLFVHGEADDTLAVRRKRRGLRRVDCRRRRS